MDAWAERLATRLAVSLSLEADEQAVMAYALKVLASTSLYFAALALLGWATGLLPEFLAAALTVGCLRSFSGGAHLSTPARCAVTGALFSWAMAAAAEALNSAAPMWFTPRTLASETTFFIASGVAFWATLAGLTALGIACFARFAPAAVPEKPIGPSQVRSLRRGSFIALAIWGVAVAAASRLLSDPGWVIASTLGYLWQLLSVTPAGFRIAGWIERLWNAFLGVREKSVTE